MASQTPRRGNPPSPAPWRAGGGPAGNAALADDLRQRLAARIDPSRGYDHGVFIPLEMMFPDADIPVIQMSLRSDMDPAAHIAAGKALAALRDEGVLIVEIGHKTLNIDAPAACM